MDQKNRRFLALLTSLLLGALFSMVSSPNEARAQQVYCTGAGCLITTSTTTTSTAGTAALVYLLVRPKNKSAAHLAAYLDVNRVAIREMLVLGSGPTRDDLATLILGDHDPELAASFDHALRTRRDELSRVLDTDGHIDADHADLFTQIICLALAEDAL